MFLKHLQAPPHNTFNAFRILAPGSLRSNSQLLLSAPLPNSPQNKETLCLSCHRTKIWKEIDYDSLSHEQDKALSEKMLQTALFSSTFDNTGTLMVQTDVHPTFKITKYEKGQDRLQVLQVK